MLEVQKLLREQGLEGLKELFVRVCRHRKLPLISLSYTQGQSPKLHPVVRECRGLVLELDTWEVVAYPFRRFFNYLEEGSDDLDWESAVIQEKLDGSLMILYPYKGEWYVATSGTPDARFNVPVDPNVSFKNLFWRLWREKGYELPDRYVYPRTYMFEMMTAYNPVVVRHDEPRLVLHGVRDLETLQEQSPQPFAERYNWECVKQVEFSSVLEAVEAASSLDGFESEGYIACDRDFNRVKIKSHDYVRKSYSKAGITTADILLAVVKGEIDEFLAYFFEFRSIARDIQDRYQAHIQNVVDEWKTVEHIQDRKTFAQVVSSCKYASILFGLRDGIPSVEEYYRLNLVKYEGLTLKNLKKRLNLEIRKVGL